MTKNCRALFDQWNNAVRYCHWKSNEHLVEGLCGKTDLDILMSDADKEVGRKILSNVGFMKCCTQYGSRYPDVEDWLGYDEDSGRLIHVHLHFKIVTGHKGMKEYNLPYTSLALETRILDKETNVYVCEPNLELVILYTRLGLKVSPAVHIEAIIGAYKMSNDIKRELDYLKARVDKSSVEEIVRMFWGKAADKIITLIWEDIITTKSILKIKQIAENSFKLFRRWSAIGTISRKYYFFVALKLRDILKRKYGVIIRTRKAAGRMPGLKVAFLGQDGSGKSTITNDIIKWLGWKLEVKRFYFGSGDHFNPWQKRLYKSLSNKEGTLRGVVCGTLKIWLYYKWSSYIKRTIRRAERYSKKGGIAIFDRFPQTQFHGINDGPKLRIVAQERIKSIILRKIALMLAKIEERRVVKVSSNEPDIVFKLLLPVEESHRRKPKERIESIEKKHTIINQLTFKRAKVYNIDATQNYDDELKLIKTIIWQQIQ